MGWPVAAGEDVTKTENFKRRLWVAAVDQTIGTVDPSHPAFYLTGQDDTPNMRGFWANAQCIATPAPDHGGGACTQGFECCSGFCTNGTCTNVSTLACQAIGGSCTTSADCPNPATQCNAGLCSYQPCTGLSCSFRGAGPGTCLPTPQSSGSSASSSASRSPSSIAT